MTHITFAGLSLPIPTGFVDRSTVVFALLPEESADPRVKAVNTPPVNIVVAKEAAAKRTLTALIDEKLADLGKALPGFKILRRGQEDRADAAAEIAFCEYSAQIGPALVQLLAARAVGDDIIVLTGTAQAASFAKHRDAMLAVLRDATLT